MDEGKVMNGRYLKSHSIFSGLNEEQLQDVGKMAKLHVLNRRKRLLVDNVRSNRIYFLISGKMKVADHAGKINQPVMDILYPGEMFGNISLNGIYNESYAEALLPNTLVYCFPAPEFQKLLQVHHGLALNYADQVGHKLQQLQERYAIWTQYDTRTRFVYLLHNWANKEGQEEGGSLILSNHVSLTDLAEILSVSRQFIYVLLKELTTVGLLKYSRQRREVDQVRMKEMMEEVLS